ncbi:MAG: hypothetical protein HYY92_00640 [Parcubacteria group bacterium]|nr:hypothetical protein [Parcubacteria group bacterium]
MREIGNTGLLLRIICHPFLYLYVKKGPIVKSDDTTTTLDEWLVIDHMQTDTVVKIIGCKCPRSHKEQQMERIVIYKQFGLHTFGEVMRLKGEKKKAVKEAQASLTAQFKTAKQCHRNFGKDGTFLIRCYCDEHTH